MKKTWILLVISVLCLGLFTACASSADTMPSPSPAATNTPAATAQPTPSVSIEPAVTEAPASNSVATVEDVLRVSDDVSEEVEKLSELKSADAIVAGNMALVGITYDDQYQGGLTDRLTEMVKTRAESIDKTITSVQVTDDEEAVKKIAELKKKLGDGSMTFEELQTELLTISSSIQQASKS
ncbi:YhcN/YlaJ family sporulation lipoprotein [bacterium]|nr:YhcN/YlaJ family sporulation lipoprotein [bacterium]